MSKRPGQSHSPETRQKIGASSRARQSDPAMKAKMLAGLREANADRRKLVPLILPDLGVGQLVTLSVADLRKLNVDDRYQRIRITTMVSRLMHVIQNGGIIADPITVVRRADGSLWIVDGQQRWWAHIELERPLRALIFDVKDFEQERRLFLVMNTKVNVNADTIVKAWPGPTGQLLRALDVEGSAYFGHINWGYANGRPYGAGILARAVLAAAANMAHAGVIGDILMRADVALAESAAAARAAGLLKLIPLVWQPHPRARVRLLSALALAHVAFERWGAGVTFPPPRVYRALERVKWDSKVPSYAAQYLPVLETIIRKRWPA